MRKTAVALAVALALACLAPLAAQEASRESAAADRPGASYTLGGSVESRPFARLAGLSDSAADDFAWGQSTSLALELACSGSRARAAASIEAALLSGAAADDAWAAAAAARLVGLETGGLLLLPAYDASASAAPETLVEARLRALYLKLDWDFLSLEAGRQVVNFRRGALWSPVDVFTELDLSGISPVRRGSDALRIGLPIGATGAFDLVAAPAKSPREGRYAARLSGLVAGLDGAAIAYRDGKAGTWNAGADFQADLIIGLNAQALYSMPDSGKGWTRAAAGMDWSRGDLAFAAEYYYNGGGAAADANAPVSHNAYAALSWNASDFLSLAASGTIGLPDGAWGAAATAALDAAQNAQVQAYARLARARLGGGRWAAEAGLELAVQF
jgi:hypothetical protein